MKINGFTLIELVVVIVILGVLSSVALPKFIDLQDDANQAVMLAMKGSLKSANDILAAKILVSPDQLNNRQNRYTLDNGQVIRVRGQLPDGLWNNTFAHLVDFEDIAQVSSNACSDPDLKWCVRQRGQNWFNSRGYATLGTGRGFVIYPNGYNANLTRCHIYFINQNNTPVPATVSPVIIGHDFSGC